MIKSSFPKTLKEGCLEDFDNKRNTNILIPKVHDKKMIFGRTLVVHDIVKNLVDPTKKIVIL